MFRSSVFFPSYDIVFNPCFLFLIFLICSCFHCFYSPLFASSSADMPKRSGSPGRLGESRLIADGKATMVRYPARVAEKRETRCALLFTHLFFLWRPMFLRPLRQLWIGRPFFRQISQSSWTWASFPGHLTALRWFVPFQLPTSLTHDSHVLDVFPISKFPDATCCICHCYHFPSTCHLLSHIKYYTFTSL